MRFRSSTFLSKLPPVCLLLLIFCFAGPAFSQGKPSIKWGRFNLLSLDSTWKYKSGKARPEYFTRNFDDSHWRKVPSNFIEGLGPVNQDWTGTGLFRKAFRMPDSLQGRQFELLLNQCGASEIYLDGKLVWRFGKISDPDSAEIVIQKTIPVLIDSASQHLLVLYYSNLIKPALMERYQLTGYIIQLSPVDPSGQGEDDNDPLHHIVISLGIILTFCLFFWFVYAFYPFRQASLVTALFLTNFSCIFGGGLFRDYIGQGLNAFIVGEKIWEIGFSCCYGWYVLFLYSIYYGRFTWRSWVILAMIVFSIILIVSMSAQWFNIALSFIIVYVLEAWRIIVLGIRHKKTGFWIIAIGLFLALVGVLTTIFDVFNLFPWYLTETQTILAVATDLSFPLTLALHFAWEFGSANRDLRIQLKHVKELSDKTSEQEKEKQQLLASQNEQLELLVTDRTHELNNSLNELKSTQSQLIQSEKMASLGELTAGIAHEIQNPLNFVNNFSEISAELVDDLNLELDKGQIVEAKSIAQDLKQNLEKIAHHGKRADSVVKGMLQHSRTSSGQREPTDVNALAEEFFRLSYHGIRAKDKSFNAGMKTFFDPEIGKINVIQQDLGRVLLNLFNNAFYAVNDKRKINFAGYEPMVIVRTRKMTDKVEISVEDNGNGIPVDLVSKIFQPFFTTKPTGEGTGLGLSLSYDIIKTAGGEIAVDSIPGESTIFKITLPGS